MKKKLVVLSVVLILVLSIVLSGCNLFTTDEERDYKQVLVTVEHQGMKATVTKGEFLEYFNQNFQMYNYYYQWSADKCAEEFIKTLAKKEILLLEARAYFATKLSIAKDSDIMKFLGADERKWVIEQSNKQFQDNMDSIVKDLIATDKANNEEDDSDTDEETTENLAPRPTMDKDEDTAFKPDGSITDKDIPEHFFDALSKKELNDFEKDAKKELEKQLKKQYKDYNYFLTLQAESRLLTKYKEANQTFTITDEEVMRKYTVTLDKNKQEYKTAASYKSALESDGSVIVYHNGQYVKVKSILLKFTEEQSAILKALQTKYTGDEYRDILNAYRKMIVTGDTAATDFPILVKDGTLGLVVNVSNLDYDENAICELENCTCPACENNPANVDKTTYPKHTIDRDQIDESGNKVVLEGCDCAACENNAYERFNVPFTEILSELSESLNKIRTDSEKEYGTKYTDGNAAGKTMYVQSKLLEEFNRWIYKVNDDEGMFEGKDYIETPEGQDSSYVPEYTALVRALLRDKGTPGSVKVTDGTTSYEVKGKTYDIYTQDDVSYIINDFGVHVVMLSVVSVDKQVNSGKYTETVKDADGNIYYTLSKDAYVQFDKDTGKALTVLDVLRKQTEESAKNDAYNKFETKFFDQFGDDFFSKDNVAKGIKRNTTLYNKLKSELVAAAEKANQ